MRRVTASRVGSRHRHKDTRKAVWGKVSFFSLLSSVWNEQPNCSLPNLLCALTVGLYGYATRLLAMCATQAGG